MTGSDTIIMRTNALWEQIGSALEKAVADALKCQDFPRAIMLAKHAEACLWHSTGEASVFDLSGKIGEV